MHAARVTERISSVGIGLIKSPTMAALAGGSLLGALAVSTWLPWTLTWGDDRAFAAAAALMLVLGLLAGSRARRILSPGWIGSALIACGWTLLQPVVLRGLAATLAVVP